MLQPSTFLVFGATGGTGKHFVPLALNAGHTVRALVRNPAKLPLEHPNLQVRQGSITEDVDLDELVRGSDFVIAMLGDRVQQQHATINRSFVERLIPAMRRHGVKRFLYQAGGLSRPYQGHLSPILWTIRHTIARGFDGQHRDNEAVMVYLAEKAADMEWIVHRAGIVGDGPSKGTLVRSNTKFSIGTFRDCAAYNFRTLTETAAIHTSDFSHYAKG
jgi:nucleoside-diphosphate-sugar epimerase